MNTAASKFLQALQIHKNANKPYYLCLTKTNKSATVMPKNKEQLNLFSEKLRDDLTPLTEEDLRRRRRAHFQKIVDKPLDKIELGEDEFRILDHISHICTNGVRDYPELSQNVFPYDNVEDIKNKDHMSYGQFLRQLSFNLLKFERRERDDQWAHNKTIDEMLLDLKHSRPFDQRRIQLKLEMSFEHQAKPCQIKIMKAILEENHSDKSWCYNILLSYWWDEAIKSSVEKAWKNTHDPKCAEVIAHRFPHEYVLKHHQELGNVNYSAVCNRLGGDGRFTLDKSRLTREEYFNVLRLFNTHLPQEEAEQLLYGYILESLRYDKRPQAYNFDIILDDIFFFPDLCDYVEEKLSQLPSLKPSLFFLPNSYFYAYSLVESGCGKVLKEFMVWNNYLQSKISTFSPKTDTPISRIGEIKEEFVDYLDSSWQRFSEIALEEFPIPLEDIKDGFLTYPHISDENDNSDETDELDKFDEPREETIDSEEDTSLFIDPLDDVPF